MKSLTPRPTAVSAVLFAASMCLLPRGTAAQNPAQQVKDAAQTGTQQVKDKLQQAGGQVTGAGSKDTSTGQGDGKDKNSASKPAGAGEMAASTTKLRLGPLDPSVPPTNLPKGRPVIGLAMGGGAALGFTEIGALEWMEQHHIPVDVIAGTSMGSILAALYSTGKTTDEMKHILNDQTVGRVFRISSDYTALNYRRREDQRDIPSGIGIGLKHGVNLRNSLLTDTGLNELLDREFLSYNDQTDFNDLPIPFRCQATDLTDAKTVTFSRGSLQDAVRASASIPGAFRPFELNGHEFVDGAILQNLPTPEVRAMKADVVIAISLPLNPVGKGDLDSILGVLGRAFSVGIENNEAASRKLADVVIMPDTKGFTANDYPKAEELAKRGYVAAEAHKAELLKYAVSDAEWAAYLAKKTGKTRPPAGTVLKVSVTAPSPEMKEIGETVFANLAGQKLDPDAVERKLGFIRADGRYDADYTVGYDNKVDDRPIILVAIHDKKTGPPFLSLGLNLEAQSGGITRATFASSLIYQDLGGFGSGLRVRLNLGYLTKAEAEYYWKPQPLGRFFLAPRGGITRRSYYIYNPNSNFRISERQSQFAGIAGDAGVTDGRFQELRAGYSFDNVSWQAITGSDTLGDYSGNAQTARLRYVFDNQDRALVPRYGLRTIANAGYQFGTGSSPSAPKIQAEFVFAKTLSKKNTLLGKAEGGTYFNRNVAQPFRFTLGGPLRLAGSSLDQLRGTDYFLLTPGYLRRIAQLPAPLNSALYVGGAYEFGQMRAPGMLNQTRQDVYFGLIAETPVGVITLAPAFGDHGARKFTFTLGKFF